VGKERRAMTGGRTVKRKGRNINCFLQKEKLQTREKGGHPSPSVLTSKKDVDFWGGGEGGDFLRVILLETKRKGGKGPSRPSLFSTSYRQKKQIRIDRVRAPLFLCGGQPPQRQRLPFG